jgi:hypothetical protein
VRGTRAVAVRRGARGVLTGGTMVGGGMRTVGRGLRVIGADRGLMIYSGLGTGGPQGQ